ncbi:MAG: hypothetical protein M1834_004727 [Cirrosporium novae-zelandiae]|nr:MAG: hypothetical protein M1834_004727 [Cirrosporium novae-zelandiae]
MADPYSIAHVILEIIDITRDVTLNVFQKIQNEEKKVGQLCTEFINEKQDTDACVNDIRKSSNDDLRSYIPPEALREVTVLRDKLNKCVEQAESQFQPNKMTIKSARGARGYTTLVKFAFGRRHDRLNRASESLGGLVKALRDINQALKVLVQPLPEHSSPRESWIAPPPITTPTASSKTSGSSTTIRSFKTVPESFPIVNFWHRKIPETASPPVKPHIPLLSAFYEMALQGITEISSIRKDPIMSRAVSRLKVWGSGIFEEPLPLDQIFAFNRASDSLLRKCLMRGFVDILVLQEQECLRLSLEANDRQQSISQKLSIEIKALLGTDEALPLALEDWTYRVSQQEDSREIANIDTIPMIIESLFDLLPEIMAVRHTFFLQHEFSERAYRLQEKTNIPEMVDRAQLHEGYEKGIEKVENILKARDGDPQKNRRNRKLDTFTLGKEQGQPRKLNESWVCFPKVVYNESKLLEDRLYSKKTLRTR